MLLIEWETMKEEKMMRIYNTTRSNDDPFFMINFIHPFKQRRKMLLFYYALYGLMSKLLSQPSFDG